MTLLALAGVTKGYGEGASRTPVLHDINLEIGEGEFVAVVGFSGSGKTTLISAIAGLIEPDAGTITKHGQPIAGAGPDRGIVFQSYSLMPWLTVHGNVALAVNQVFRDWPKQKREAQVRKYVEMVGLGPAAHKRPAELSGGMRQRVAVARALAASPDILLLDEPLSALDALTRANLQDEILRIWEQDRKTVILITNDVDEGLLMADRIIPLKPGPNATLGPEFRIELPRPRLRTEMNHDPDFKRLRNEITQYLMGVGGTAAAAETGNVSLPPVRPNTSIDWKLDTTALKPATPQPKPMGGDRYLEFTQLSKIYPTPKGPVAVVEDFNLKVRQGEFISLIGHSGCGKSTVLSMCAGLNPISAGGIILDGKEIDGAGPDRAVVFQAPSLFPWLTAFENVYLGVASVYPHARQSERDDIVEYYLTRVGLADAMHKQASELSNGMKQRVGIARAFALSPKLLLLDEPFGMLDSLTRWELQEVLMEVWDRTKLTALMVTHDVDEAILLADRVVMMTNGPRARVGKVVEIDIPRPRSRKALLEHPDYYAYRESLITFLAECDRH
jgi:nitrate/nitrite transport system ATP-binding protein